MWFTPRLHSWEWGRNENSNGLVRQYLAKRKSQKHTTQKDCDAIASQLNDRFSNLTGILDIRTIAVM